MDKENLFIFISTFFVNLFFNIAALLSSYFGPFCIVNYKYDDKEERMVHSNIVAGVLMAENYYCVINAGIYHLTGIFLCLGLFNLS